MAKFINKMKDLMFGEYEDDEDYYEDDYEYEAPAREAARRFCTICHSFPTFVSEG